MMRVIFLALLVYVALSAWLNAQTILTPDEFSRDMTGNTVYFRFPNGDLAAEQYFDNRDVVWLVAGEDCRQGRWEPREDQICFQYDVEPGEWHCWYYIADGAGRYAHRLIEDADAPYDIEILKIDKRPLQCPGPAVGVSYTPSVSNP